MMSCRDVSALVSANLDRSLSIQERFVMRAHLLFCQACNEYSRQIRILEKALRTRMSEEERFLENTEIGLSEGSRNKIVQSLREEIRRRDSGETP